MQHPPCSTGHAAPAVQHPPCNTRRAAPAMRYPPCGTRRPALTVQHSLSSTRRSVPATEHPLSAPGTRRPSPSICTHAPPASPPRQAPLGKHPSASTPRQAPLGKHPSASTPRQRTAARDAVLPGFRSSASVRACSGQLQPCTPAAVVAARRGRLQGTSPGLCKHFVGTDTGADCADAGPAAADHVAFTAGTLVNSPTVTPALIAVRARRASMARSDLAVRRRDAEACRVFASGCVVRKLRLHDAFRVNGQAPRCRHGRSGHPPRT
ncbi:hypothetical protein SAMN05216551_103355 [Chitinasiproducens palmae]|uniref:Uncharacterized protein n=1 Tax=Chitinasiproducens palmae TaxID=1770053 RepID=A0A1H2PMS0_9BURK|nr:hypothetical protein SAMN05216551_103355 [Chitinasiproducens palmae]